VPDPSPAVACSGEGVNSEGGPPPALRQLPSEIFSCYEGPCPRGHCCFAFLGAESGNLEEEEPIFDEDACITTVAASTAASAEDSCGSRQEVIATGDSAALALGEGDAASEGGSNEEQALSCGRASAGSQEGYSGSEGGSACWEGFAADEGSNCCEEEASCCEQEASYEGEASAHDECPSVKSATSRRIPAPYSWEGYNFSPFRGGVAAVSAFNAFAYGDCSQGAAANHCPSTCAAAELTRCELPSSRVNEPGQKRTRSPLPPLAPYAGVAGPAYALHIDWTLPPAAEQFGPEDYCPVPPSWQCLKTKAKQVLAASRAAEAAAAADDALAAGRRGACWGAPPAPASGDDGSSPRDHCQWHSLKEEAHHVLQASMAAEAAEEAAAACAAAVAEVKAAMPRQGPCFSYSRTDDTPPVVPYSHAMYMSELDQGLHALKLEVRA
jgi:hypothetical protein